MTHPMRATADPAGDLLAEQGWGRILRISVARVLLTLVVSLLAWSLLPAVVGYTPRVIMSGSMEPKIIPGDVIITRTVPPGTLNQGQVITVKDPDRPGRTRTHRLMRRDSGGRLVLRGDANQQEDSSHVAASRVLGVGVLRVPYVGQPLYWLAERNWAALLALVVSGSWCLLTVLPIPRPSRDGEAGGPRPRGWTVRRCVAVAVTAGVVGVLLWGTTLGGPLEAAFLRAAAKPSNTLNSVASFYFNSTAVPADALGAVALLLAIAISVSQLHRSCNRQRPSIRPPRRGGKRRRIVITAAAGAAFAVSLSPINSSDAAFATDTRNTGTALQAASSATFNGLMDANSATFDGSTAHWAPWYSASLSLSTEQSHRGTASLKVIVTGIYGWGVQLDNYPGFPIIGGSRTVSYWSRAGSPGTIGAIASLAIHWKDSSGSDLLVTTLPSPPLATAWQHATIDVTAPVGTTAMFAQITGNNSIDDYVYFDDISVG